MSNLALLGGEPVRTQPFPAYNTMGEEEVAAATRVIRSGNLSQYLGAWHPDFFGGPEVTAFEAEWAAAHKAKHAVSVNSATSGLYAAIGAAGVGPGDEVIVSPTTMMASATAPLIFNAVPVFADVDPITFCLSPESIAARVTPRTRAIVVVHIFGGPADMDPIMELARRHGLIVIEDCAQAPLGSYRGRPVGTLGHILIVRDHDDGLAIGMQLAQQVEDFQAGLGIQVAGGLIGQDHQRIVHQGPRHGDALLLAAGEL